MTIFFYKVQDPYGCFSNFSLYSIDLQGQTWPTSEHYYQAQKYQGTPHQALCEEIRQTSTPEAAAAIGRNPLYAEQDNWDVIKPEIMYAAVHVKFLTHPTIQAELLSTGDERIVENSPLDSYWGCGADGKGHNQLGKILMQVRQEIRQLIQTGAISG
ncbi:NADAR family protein [Acaryochloris marina]|uniref:NADAR family protein n=1 Tax=Acaryochloris marina TaxID=155978 RepID=UPI001BAEFF45|nr:NADAR family protein [Acaryochloris marina]QUY42320.1 NADAR family protein [Acaryochloris marina S15]